MKYFLIIIIIIFSLSFSLSAQVQAVIIAQDSPDTIQERIESFIHHAKMVKHAVDQVTYAADTLQAQLRVIKTLKEGNINSLLSAYHQQIEVIDRYYETMDNTDYLKEIKAIEVLLESSDFKATKLNLKKLSNSMKGAGRVMLGTRDLIENSKKRIEKFEEIDELSKSTESVSGNLTLVVSALSNLSAGVNDSIVAATTYNQAIAMEQQNEIIKEELAELQNEQFFQITEEDKETYFESEVGDEEYYNSIFGEYND